MKIKDVEKALEKYVDKNLSREDAKLVIKNIREVVDDMSLEYSVPPMVDYGKSRGDYNYFNFLSENLDFRPTDSLSFTVINQMIKSAPVRFALEMKRSQIVSVFRNERSWKVHSPDTELAEIVDANLKQILPRMAIDFSYSSLVYGVSFQELIWQYKNKYQLGLADSKYQTNRKFVVAKVPNSVNPETVPYIKRDMDGRFNGFIQVPYGRAGLIEHPMGSSGFLGSEIDIPKDSSLIITYNEKFRNLWGESFLKPIYPIWFWYEVVMRAMVTYMERIGTPVVLVKAPSRATITRPGTRTKVDGISWGMEIGSNVSRSTVAVIPSDTDDGGKPLWDLSYLATTERSEPFMEILELLTQMIIRAGMSADRSLTQSSGGVGSFNIGSIHKEATALHNELILAQWTQALNTYFLPLYSLYNRGENGPPIWLETQGLDPSDRDNLKTILGIAQGLESFKNVGFQIDWESLLTINNIPLLTEEEGESKRKKSEEEAMEKQRETLDLQSQYETPSPTKNPDGSLKANLPNRPPPKKEEIKQELNEEVVELEQPIKRKRGRPRKNQ